MKIISLWLWIVILSTAIACTKDKIDDPGDDGETSAGITLNKSQITLPAQGGTETFTINAKGAWNIVGSKVWCAVSPNSGGAGETQITVNVSADETLYEDRNTTLTIGDQHLLVTQKKLNALILTQDKFTVPVEGQTIEIEVKYNVDYDVVIPETYKGWISEVVKSKALSESSFKFTIAASEESEIRYGEIIIKDKQSTLSDTVKIYQAATYILALENDNMIIKPESGEFMVELRTNLAYDIVIPDAYSWVKQAPESKAIRDDRVNFTIDALQGDDNREAIIIFKAKGTDLLDTLGICQVADGSLLLMRSLFEIKADNDTIDVRMKATEFEAKILDGYMWVEKINVPVVTRSAFRKDSVRLAIKQNTWGEARTARIVFTERSTQLTDTLKIRQAASTVKPIIAGNRAMISSYNSKRSGGKWILLSWRYLPSDPQDVAFDIYRSTNGGPEVLLNSAPISNSSNFKDATANIAKSHTYRVTQRGSDQTLCSCTFKPSDATNFYRSILLNMSVPDPSLTYAPGDASVGDLDGDGEYEIVLKREVDPTDNTGDRPQEGTMLLEAYKLDGTFMWRVDMGANIRQGAHYTPFIVNDFDGDGRAEIAIRTAEGTRFGDGTTIGDVNRDGKTNYVNPVTGMVLEGPEFLSIIDGGNGSELTRIDYIPRGDKSTWTDYWGDNWGNRIDRFLMATGNFGGSRPSIVMCRGYYHNFQIVALDYQGGTLTKRWHFNTSPSYQNYRSQGNHNLSVGDVDNDGMDEIIYGACAIDHDGKGLYSTGLGHGDALHLGDLDPSRPGLEVWTCHEDPKAFGQNGSEYRDAASGKVIFGIPAGSDVGRCLVADIDPDYPGCEMWSSASGGIYSCKGEKISDRVPTAVGGGDTYNMAIWWSGSLNRQLLDRNVIQSYKDGRLLTGADWHVTENNGTKANPCFYGDIWGDWREEVIWRSSDNRELRIFTTDYETQYRFHPLMEDHIYKLSAIHQNNGYNQPTHTGFYLGSDLFKIK